MTPRTIGCFTRATLNCRRRREPVIDGRFNLWRGWSVKPKRGEWGLMREHMFEVLAARDDDVDLYNYNWLAWCVQHPAEQAVPQMARL